MGAFYYPSMEPAYPYIFYASAEEGLKAAIELAEKLRDTYDEIYLVDPNINFHIHEAGIGRGDIPPCLRILVSERTSSRIPFQQMNAKIKRVYLFFENAGYVPSSYALTVIILSVPEMLDRLRSGDIEMGTLRPSPTLQAYK